MAEAWQLSGLFTVVGFLDDALLAGEMALGLPVLGLVASIAQYRRVADQDTVVTGNNAVRKKLMQ